MEFFEDLHPIVQALLATLFTWGVTALGAASVLLIREFNQKFLDAMLGFAGGVMIAASYWSLLAPSIELAEEQGVPAWLPAVVGFMAGGGALRLIDRVLPHMHPLLRGDGVEGPPTHWRRSLLLVLAITLHNIPEGMAVGVAFGAAAQGLTAASVGAALALALGIGLQNFPEGMAVAMPLRRENVSGLKAFWYGQLSATVEPVAGVVGAAAVMLARPLLPYLLSFAAGAMVFVVIEEVIPSAQENDNFDLATGTFMAGFSVMMFLDVALG